MKIFFDPAGLSCEDYLDRPTKYSSSYDQAY